MAKASAFFQLDAAAGKHDMKQLKKELDACRGVTSVSVNARKNTVSVDYDDSGVHAEKLGQTIESMGFGIQVQATQEHLM